MWIFFHLHFQEGPEAICVFGLMTRTTASLEAYNGHLGRKIMSHANFFVLCTALIDEEFTKCQEFELSLKSADEQLQRRPFRLRDEKISKLSSRLENKRITVDQFLNGIIFDPSHISTQQCEFNVSDDSDDSTESYQSSTVPSSSQGVVSGKTCAVCLEAQSDVLLGCGHYKYCIACFDTERAMFDQRKVEYQLGRRDVEPKFKCPLCQTEITQHMHIQKIFVD